MTAISRFLKRYRKSEPEEQTFRFVAPGEKETAVMDLITAEQPKRGIVVPRPSNSKDVSMDADTQIQGASITRFFGDTFNPYSYSTFNKLYQYDEPSFYRDYQESYLQNPFTHMVTEYLMNECFANDFHLEGPGAGVVEKFFKMDNTRAKIKMSFREAIKKGNGFMDVGRKRGNATRTRVLLTDDITVELDEKTGERKYTQGTTQLNPEYLIHFMIQEEVGNPYGISIYRSNLLFLTALMDVGGDIMAALKRVAYAPMVASLDFEGVPDDTRRTVMADWKAKLKEMESATQNFVVDKKHTLSLLGQGAAGAKLLPTNDLIEPIIAVILINFGIPLGMYLQTGANKAIIEEQRLAMNRFYEDLRTKLKYTIETKIIPHITGRETRVVFNRPPLSIEDTQKEFKILLEAFEKGLLSRDYILDHMDIEDTGDVSKKETDKQEVDKQEVEKPSPEVNDDGEERK